MSNPSILSSLYVKPVNSKEFGVFSSTQIYRNSTIEFCAWIPISQKTQLLLKNNDRVLDNRLFVNPDGMNKEREIAERLADLNLQERLDRGLISTEQFKSIVYDVVNPNKMLHIDSHAILLGFGSIYRRSASPNINWDYDSEKKLYKFYTVQDIDPDQELTYFLN
ncbi:hypothetical protein UFOVP1604_9 [uncultured Caudovirales phage]|uniref:SET domain-containing protein n=1 Tax=uncultured Caudovirales phage TaxID=2100421 RepID=A0A6J5SSB1_9CAUD|nr:hypothetical protein UFOVP1604_9 [uncultured Caudovirales phage]